MYDTHFHEPFFSISKHVERNYHLFAMSARYGVDLKLNNYRACEHLVVDEIINLSTDTTTSSDVDIEI